MTMNPILIFLLSKLTKPYKLEINSFIQQIRNFHSKIFHINRKICSVSATSVIRILPSLAPIFKT